MVNGSLFMQTVSDVLSACPILSIFHVRDKSGCNPCVDVALTCLKMVGYGLTIVGSARGAAFVGKLIYALPASPHLLMIRTFTGITIAYPLMLTGWFLYTAFANRDVKQIVVATAIAVFAVALLTQIHLPLIKAGGTAAIHAYNNMSPQDFKLIVGLTVGIISLIVCMDKAGVNF